MNLKIVITIIVSFLASSVLIIAILKKLNPNFGNLGNKTFWVNIGSGLLGSVVTYLVSLMINDYLWMYVFIGLVSLLLGLIFFLLFHKSFFNYKKHNYQQQFVTEFFYAFSVLNIIVAGFIAARHFISLESNLVYPIIGSLLLFLVPLLLYQSYYMIANIDIPIYNHWSYPVQEEIPLLEEHDGDKILVLALKLIKTTSQDEDYTVFRTKAPEEMVLGDLLYHFINEYNEVQSETPIAYMDSKLVPYKWYLYKERKGWKSARVLEPNTSIKKNNLNEDDIIVCDRIIESN